ncbi:hypothetical protein EDB85DRAFT_1055253 [Lactarius pseudohatsudake]|nr:hypothetical protein EDB85DRAFT_1055253 [Lactarius pseudohatsudake]
MEPHVHTTLANTCVHTQGRRGTPAYKQSKHRPPTLIRERVFKTPGTLRRTAFTSIPRQIRTDFETLRPSIVIARDNEVLLPRLPGFGLNKAARPKNTFEQPFRTAPRPPRYYRAAWRRRHGQTNRRLARPFLGFELDRNSPFPDPAPARGNGSSKLAHEREGAPTVGHRARQGPRGG